MKRRDFLKAAAGALSLAGVCAGGAPAEQSDFDLWVKGVCDYLESLRLASGGYA